MKIFKKLSLLCLAFVMVGVGAICFTACGKNKDWNKIELNEVTHSIFYAPLYVAINKGYFKEEGLTVTLTNGGGSDTSMTALLTGSADIILAGPETVVYTNKEGVSDAPVVFGQLTACDGSFIVSKENETDFDLSNLVGQTIIGGRKGGLPAMTLEYILKTKGYKFGTGADQINLRTDVAFNLTASVWEGDASVKYCTLFEPTASNVQKAGKGYVVASVGELSGSIPYTCFATKQSYLKDHPLQAEKFLMAVQKGYKLLMDETKIDEAAQALLPSFEGNTLEEMKAAITAYKSINAWSDDMILEEDSFTNLINVMISAGVIDSAATYEACVDNTIAKQIKLAA